VRAELTECHIADCNSHPIWVIAGKAIQPARRAHIGRKTIMAFSRTY
jgi:hypothetical protein